MKRLVLTIALAFIAVFSAFAQEKETYLYAEKDSTKLYMDVYVPKVQNEQQSCLVFVFGGGFISGRRVDSQVQEGYFNHCPITFQDIATTKQVLTEKLMTIYHTRVQYPTLETKTGK